MMKAVETMRAAVDVTLHLVKQIETSISPLQQTHPNPGLIQWWWVIHLPAQTEAGWCLRSAASAWPCLLNT